MINVTKTVLPPLDAFVSAVEGVWERGWVTNHGPLVTELEERLREALGVRHFLYTANGTLALQLALRALNVTGEVITTPFSYVATTSSIVWERATPVFVDIDPKTFCVDAERIADAVTDETTAILVTHVYGIPCHVDRIATIAREHGLRVIYDAAHAFGVTFAGRPLLTFGDASAISFHATKLFHTAEGGGLATNDDEIAHTASFMRNFGHRGQDEYWGLGINAKGSEIHAALGLTLLPLVPEIIEGRRVRVELYRELLSAAQVVPWELPESTEWNYAYFPVVFRDEQELLRVRDALNADSVFPRRYFNPSLDCLPYVDPRATPVATDLAPRVLCLPLYHDLPTAEVIAIAETVIETLGRRPG